MHCRRSSLISFAVLAVLLASCGGTEGPSASSAMSAGRTARSSGLTASYVPAAQTCAAMPGPAVVQGLVTSTPKHVSGYLVCGSFTARAGRSSFSCPLPAGAVGPYRLLLYNGNLDGTARAESATIRVNGRAVLDHDDFDEKVQAATAPVVLASANTIDVRIEERRALVRLQIVDEGQACSILQPSFVSEATSPFAVSFRSTNAFPIPELQLFNGVPVGMRKGEKGSVSLNGATVLSRKQFHEQMSAFLASVSVSSTNRITATAGQQQGPGEDKGHGGADVEEKHRSAEVRRQYSVQIVDRDKTPPTFSVAAPTDGSYTNRPQLALSGWIDDPSAQVSIGNVLGAVGSGRYSAQEALRECWNTVTVHAADVCGNSSEASVRVGLDTVPPVLALASPASGRVTNQAQQTVTLRYSDNFSGIDLSSVRLLLDGADITTTLAIGGDAATGALTLGEGRHLLRAELRDRAGNATTQEAAFLVDLTPPLLTISSPGDGALLSSSSQPLALSYRDALSGVDLSTMSVFVDGADVTKTLDVTATAASGMLHLPPGAHQVEARVSDLAGNAALARVRFTVASGLPPDPASVAPKLDPTIATNLLDASSFLYSGPNPIQTGVAPGTIQPQRVSVLRGRVSQRDGTPLPGVHIAVASHPELGSTLTRADGMFDLAVNGGGPITLNYVHDGYLPAQRQVVAPWQDYAWLPEIVLVPRDGQVTTIASGAQTLQVARGAPVTDSDGTRQATLFFPSQTQASLVLPNGTQQAGTLHVRATEYTVGSSGPKAMPADLPANSAYTYAVELSADEAVQTGAQVRFTQPVYFYLENFLNIRVGEPAPAGFYDSHQSVWSASASGRVIEILSITGGRADLDVDGSSSAASPATLAAMGFSDEERQRLAALYSPGQSLWRVPIPHFSAWDINWGWAPNPDAVPPGQPDPVPTSPEVPPPNPCDEGSEILCHTQSLGEAVPVVGTPYRLHYASDRVPDRSRSIVVQLSGNSLPGSIQGIQMQVSVAGRFFEQIFPAKTNLSTTFTWDGLDAYGRPVQGDQSAWLKIGYVYPLVRTSTSVFGYNGNGIPISASRARGNATLSQSFGQSLGGKRLSLFGWDARGLGLGGWSLDVQHGYDPTGRLLLLGSGKRASATTVNDSTITTIGGGGSVVGADGIPATQADLGYFNNGGFNSGPVVGPDGSVYVPEHSHHRVSRISTDGMIHAFAGSGVNGFGGDGGSALAAQLGALGDLGIGPDGSVYILDIGNLRVRRVWPDGTITTATGDGTYVPTSLPFYDCGGVSQTPAFPPNTSAMAIGPDGSIYLADQYCNRVRRIAPDGFITVVPGYPFSPPAGVSVGRDGTVNVVDSTNVWSLKPGGLGAWLGGCCSTAEGIAVASSYLHGAGGVTTGEDGSIYLADGLNGLIRRIDSKGIVRSVAGDHFAAQLGDGGSAFKAHLGASRIALGPGGDLYIADANLIRKVSARLPGFSLGDALVPSEDGSEVYHFDGRGRHLETIDARTKVRVLQFAYGTDSQLASLTDRDGNVTTIERDSTGRPLAIVSPYGHRTSLALDVNGFLTGITNPAGETTKLTSSTGGLLKTLTDPRGFTHGFLYDGLGRLVEDDDPAGGSKTLGISGAGSDLISTLTTRLGRTKSYEVNDQSSGISLRTDTGFDGTKATVQLFLNGDRSITTAAGMVESTSFLPDPRFGMNAALPSTSTTTPKGLRRVTSASRSAILATPNVPLTLTSLTETLSVNGYTSTSRYDVASATLSTTSAGGRRAVTTLDSLGRVAQVQAPGVLPVQVQYDSRGRPLSVAQGSRVVSYAYDALGNLASLTDPLGRQTSFAYDLAGRPTQQVLPDGRTISLAYDASGNVTSVTPPGRPAHSFAYTPVDLEQSYSPPNLGFQSTTQTSYDLDHAVSLVSRPAGDSIVPSYDAAGRLSSLTTSAGTTTVGYDPTSGHVAQLVAPGSVGLTYGYDGALLTDTSWSGPISGTVHRSYDSFFRVASESVSGGQPISYQYDPDGLLIAAGALQIQRDPATGFVTGSSLGGTTEARTYDAYGAEASYTASAGSSSLYSVTYTRDALGRIASKTERVGADAAHTFSYGYDLAGRLTDVAKDGTSTAHYAYDANGNRTAGPGLTSSPVYDDQDRMLAYGACSYTYKAGGELQTKVCPDGTTTYDYDALGNLRHVALPNRTQIDYVIDGQNRRIGKSVSGTVVEKFLYRNALHPAAWLNPDNTVKARFVYGGRPNVPEYMVLGTSTYRLVTDQVGSVRLVIDETTGAVAQRVDYDEFGVVLADSAPGFQPFGYAGGIYDGDTGLVRFGARDYGATTGRWTAKDASGFEGGPNFYEYATNDPINFLDPNGRSAAAVIAIAFEVPEIGAAVAAAGWVGGLGVAAFSAGYAVGTGINYFAGDYIQAGLDVVFSGPTKVAPHPDAAGPHCTLKRPPGGRVTGYEEYDADGNPVKRFRGEGKPHGGVRPPLILEPKAGKGPGSPPKVPRPPTPEEMPPGY